MDYKAIKVLIGTNTSGGALYPDFNTLASVRDSGMDWSHYIDRRGTGWHYDKCCAHAFDVPGSPKGVQYGMILVPKEFHDDALANFPAFVTGMTETEVEDFYNEHAHGHESEESVSDRVINGITAKQNAGIDLTDSDRKALDVNDKTPGINKNPNRYWADHKALRSINVI